MKLEKIVDKFPKKKIMVIGDVMLDKYTHCKVKRISPEAPIPIADVIKETYVPGGAGNSANNIASLDGDAYIFGVVGRNYFGTMLEDEFKQRNIDTFGLVKENGRETTLKQRTVADGQQILRTDYETTDIIEKVTETNLIKSISIKIKDMDGIIISDYAKGMITRSLVKKTIALAEKAKIPVVVDPKPNHKSYYKGATIITPNEREARAMAKLDKATIERVGEKLLKELDSNVLITRGEKGMALFKKDGTIKHFPTVAKEVYDVSGAGDTATAALTLAIASNSSLEEAVELANFAAGIVVGKVGTATTDIDEIKNVLNKKQP